MTREEASDLLNFAINQVVLNDAILLELGIAERSLTFRLAHYMQGSGLIQPPHIVDCEYNRNLKKVKQLNLPSRTVSDRAVRATTVFPDIVVHQRNNDSSNLMVLEVKKLGEDIEYDEKKLQAFKRELGYIHAAHLILGMGVSGEVHREVKWI